MGGESRIEGREPRAGKRKTEGARLPERSGGQGKQATEGERADPWEAALKFLAVRARSQEEVRLQLSRRGYLPEEVTAVLVRLTAAGYLNDQGFARDWVSARATRCGFGPARLTRELRAKGIADQDIRAALGELLAEQTPLALAEVAARRRLAALQGMPPAVGRRRLAAHLTRRGFSAEIVLRLCRQYFPSLEESPEIP